MEAVEKLEEEYPPVPEIPFDLFLSKNHKAFGGDGRLQFTDSSRNLIFEVESRSTDSPSPPHRRKLLLDAAGTTLVTMVRVIKGSWKGFEGDSGEDKELMFKVNRVLNTFMEKDFEIIVAGDNSEGTKTDIKMKGCPFMRSCTIYKGNSILAETSLMHTIGFRKHFIPRSRFRITIFPGADDLILIVALVVIFFDKRSTLVTFTIAGASPLAKEHSHGLFYYNLQLYGALNSWEDQRFGKTRKDCSF
nr:protein LURP-one-related 7 [Ipomoea batatas]